MSYAIGIRPGEASRLDRRLRQVRHLHAGVSHDRPATVDEPIFHSDRVSLLDQRVEHPVDPVAAHAEHVADRAGRASVGVSGQ